MILSGFRDLPNDGAMLLYISADGCFTGGQSRSSTRAFCGCVNVGGKCFVGPDGYDVGGVTTALQHDAVNDTAMAQPSASLHNPHTGNRDIDW